MVSATLRRKGFGVRRTRVAPLGVVLTLTFCKGLHLFLSESSPLLNEPE